jgi:cyclopropane-fatty-acyl-phospholipid synthase
MASVASNGKTGSPVLKGDYVMLGEQFSALETWLLQKIYDALGRPPVRLTLKSGASVSPETDLPVANIVIDDLKTLLWLIVDPEVGFGDAYRDGTIAVEGDLVAALESVMQSMARGNPSNWYTKFLSRGMEYFQRNSLRRSRENIHRHYDLGTDFYRLWLDRDLVYTCAYFPSLSATLEEAQTAKMDYVCRKLQLQPGERVVEAGCGWGSLALHMAQHYGVSVRAFNISREQILEARRRAKETELAHKIEFIEDDYRNISGQYDAFVSVGMLEHVGREHYGEFSKVIQRSLVETGRGFLHFIGRSQPRSFSRWTRKRIFPGAYPPALSQVMNIFERWNFSILDVENLRLHYAKTLELWLARFEKSKQRVAEMFGPEFVRAWRLYLAGSVAGFRVGTLQLFQILFARSACRRIPMTRTHLYKEVPLEREETTWMTATS